MEAIPYDGGDIGSLRVTMKGLRALCERLGAILTIGDEWIKAEHKSKVFCHGNCNTITFRYVTGTHAKARRYMFKALQEGVK